MTTNPLTEAANRLERNAAGRWTNTNETISPVIQRDDLRLVLDALYEAKDLIAGIAKIEIPPMATDGTWVARTLFCNDQVTAYQVRRLAALHAKLPARPGKER